MMAIIRISSDGEITVVDPGTPEEQARAREKVLEAARTIARSIAAKELRAARERHRSAEGDLPD
jgi:hypothetical protein